MLINKFNVTEEVIAVNTDYAPGMEIEKALGMVWVSSIRAKHVGKDIKMAFKHLVGGELTDYADMIEEARKMAFKRMVEKAKALCRCCSKCAVFNHQRNVWSS
jgi:uncharacterized protein YbjQ (UPF0145 family)